MLYSVDDLERELGQETLAQGRLIAETGGLELSLEGALTADEEGLAEGELDLSATNWRDMLAAAVASGAVNRRLADALEAGLGFVAGLSGSDDRLDVSVTFAGGFARIGPVPIGPAPRMNDGI